MNPDTLDRSLRQLGDQPAPDPDAAFAAVLEDRLRAVAHLQAMDPPAPVRRAAGRRTGWLRPAVAGVALALLAAGFALAQPARDEPLRVATASNSLVVLPDGTVDAAVPGQFVPDGSTLQTGDGGHLVAGDVELGPNRSGHVDGGIIQPASGAIPPAPKPTTTATRKVRPAQPQTKPTATTAPVNPAIPPVEETPRPDPGPGPAVTSSPTTASTVRPEPAVTPATKRPNQPAPNQPGTNTTGTKPATTPDTKGEPTTVRNEPVPMKLEALFFDGKVKLRWSGYSGPDFEAYLILRADGPAEPAYPVNESTTVVARVTPGSVLEYFDTVKEPGTRAYRVVAVNKDRRVVAASPTVRPSPKPAA